jgi:hypothetical protein
LLETLIGYVVVYAVIFAFGMRYIYVLLREGPTGADTGSPGRPPRPMAAAGSAETATGVHTLLGCRRASAFAGGRVRGEH